MISTGLPIETPEGISFTYELASLADRGKAFGIDLLIRAGILLVVGAFLMLGLQSVLPAGIGLWLILFFLLEWGYYVFFEILWAGQSPGKRLVKLRVVRTTGLPIGFYESVLRNLLRAADLLPLTYAVGALAILSTYRFQRLGDLAANTMVIREPKTALAKFVQPPAVSPNKAENSSIVLTNRERWLLQEFLWRKEQLHPDRREELARILAVPYSHRFQLPLSASATSFLQEIYTKLVDRG
jgi:uncharacterized RDD family membrane protein YckC